MCNSCDRLSPAWNCGWDMKPQQAVSGFHCTRSPSPYWQWRTNTGSDQNSCFPFHRSAPLILPNFDDGAQDVPQSLRMRECFWFVCLFVFCEAASLKAGGGRWICKLGSVHEFPIHAINIANYLWPALRFQALIHIERVSFSLKKKNSIVEGKNKNILTPHCCQYLFLRSTFPSLFLIWKKREVKQLRAPQRPVRAPSAFFLTLSPEVMPFWLFSQGRLSLWCIPQQLQNFEFVPWLEIFVKETVSECQGMCLQNSFSPEFRV